NDENYISIYINNSNIISNTEPLSEIGALRSIKDILAYLIPTMVAKKILDLYDPTINIRISKVEKYLTLQIAMKSLIAELEDIKNGFIDKE
ncbi:35294_t:CDS:2, partial [Gigaspora margarita]